MLLIADSGSTKTEWRLVDDKKNILQFSSVGINPLFNTPEQITDEVSKALLPAIAAQIITASDLKIFFYGASCSSEERNNRVKTGLLKCFPKSDIHVDHDLMGSAIAVCGREAGIAAILGTGSNTCYYDGKKIISNYGGLGYVLGDEGSGQHIGRSLIKAFLNKEMPETIAANFQERYKLNKDNIYEGVYRQPMPGRYLASFCKFAHQNIQHEFIRKMVEDCFTEFFDRNICKYPQHKEVKTGCVGSVGFYFSKILKTVADKKGVGLGKILETPVAALTLYHMEE